MSVYDYTAIDIHGHEVNLSGYSGQVLLIVNTASRCGYTPQYKDLQEIYEAYKDQGFTVLGFPCNQFGAQEPGTNEEVESFCRLNYGVTFPMFAKIDVNGEHRHPLYAYMTQQAPFRGFDRSTPGGERMHGMFEERMPEQLRNDDIKWNFTKFLVNRQGVVAGRYESPVTPQEMKPAIEALL